MFYRAVIRYSDLGSSDSITLPSHMRHMLPVGYRVYGNQLGPDTPELQKYSPQLISPLSSSALAAIGTERRLFESWPGVGSERGTSHCR
jgi:hypothetical protein